MEGFLAKYPNIDLVYAHNDDMGLGAIEAIEAAGKVPGKDIKIVTIDAVKAGMEALAAGKINYIVECSPLLGEQLFHAASAVLAGKEHPGPDHHRRGRVRPGAGEGGAARPQVLTSVVCPAAAVVARHQLWDARPVRSPTGTVRSHRPARRTAMGPEALSAANARADATETQRRSSRCAASASPFPGVKALRDVSFRLFPGEVHSLMGENGAGKSTLIKALTGVYTIDDGSIRLDGHAVEFSVAGPGPAGGHRDRLPGGQPGDQPHASPRTSSSAASPDGLG